jgi:hypothetical protein
LIPLADIATRELFEHVLRKISDAEINTEPFPHIIVPEIFPAALYPALLSAIPAPEQFAAAAYPGTGYGKGKRQWSGLAYPGLRELLLFSDLRVFLKSNRFCRALLDKFSVPGAIPSDKYKYFASGAREFNCVFDLQIDRQGYEILPHADVPSKLITFQFYLTSDDSLKNFGTLLCRTKDAGPAHRSATALRFRAYAEKTAKAFHGRPSAFWHWLERTKLGTEIGFGDSRSWYPWRMFDIVSSTPALPNHFMAFAPNDRSYHAVRMDIPASSPGRTVLRGFIRTGRGTKNYITLK